MLKKLFVLPLITLCLPCLAAADDPMFTARFNIDLCPEYKEGGVVFDIVYTVGTDPTLRAPNIVNSSIDTNTNTAVYDLTFPAFFGTTPFNVASSCRNAFGYSDASNVVSVSNCDVLALKDTDGDGIPNHLEDTNCDNFFSPGDISNPDNVDTDGDGVRDLVERLSNSDPTNPGSSPRPYIYSSAVFDPDGNGDANAVVWRGAQGLWFVRDFIQPGQHISFPFGVKGDIPLFYQPLSGTSNAAVIRRVGNDYLWLFRGVGFTRSTGAQETAITFGIFGDNIVPGAWEQAGMTSPAIARLFNGVWTWVIYLRDGTLKYVEWGGNGDIPKPQDFDGDGILDVAVYRPSLGKTYYLSSITGMPHTEDFGSGTAEHTVRGDFTGDGKEDITTWESGTGLFASMTSDNGFDSAAAAAKDPNHYFELPLGLYNVHLPINWNKRGGILLYTVIDHAQGLRYWRDNNSPTGTIRSEQWGVVGDHQG
jgi:hypothetical protein